MHRGLLPDLIAAGALVILVFVGIGFTFRAMYQAEHANKPAHYNTGPQDPRATG